MKQTMLLLIAGALFSSAAAANSISCYVDTRALDYPTENACRGKDRLSPYQYYGKVVFNVNTNKTINHIEWAVSGDNFGYTCDSKGCVVKVGTGENIVKACVDKVYYQDNTWADVNWCATAISYFALDGTVPN